MVTFKVLLNLFKKKTSKSDKILANVTTKQAHLIINLDDVIIEISDQTGGYEVNYSY